ncbi:transcriptional regulator Kaiso [Xenopus laevis]|uniref:Transcriptional regulator Kaiso n=1 Tax=Xenopus laevis TaxID=8355 RepID=KAISO_XENLA|nr:transcriptional regulator Kaiso [Xenopus laevis]Q8UVQ4.2 RecName: Full=Transcriptional regulator Kaiso; AltName: Full=Zinc finger and BTB domain-containing protein 33; Short=xKaiso [Xenopus laevis]AAH70994.1 Kaiso protein [Xenopus laevis]AAK95689.1 DNA-methylation dependent transcriptional repressor Kaiso-like protein [Xenopus laevis]
METKKLITATDTQYSGILLNALNDQRIQGLYCDVTVIVEDRKFRAHRNILSACSTYFHQLFSVAGQVVELNFVKADIFAEILNYIYSSKIVRVRCDMLEELIKSGKLLGVPFIAELGIPLSQVKSISGAGGKDGGTDAPSNPDHKAPEPQKSSDSPLPCTVKIKADVKTEMPVITESFSLSSDDYKDKKASGSQDHNSEKEDDDDDVIFCSEIVSSKQAPAERKEAAQTQIPPDNEQVPEVKKVTPSSQVQLTQNSLPTNQQSSKNTSSTTQKFTPPVNANISKNPTPAANGFLSPTAQKQGTPNAVQNQHSQNITSGNALPQQKPVVNFSSIKPQQISAIKPKTEVIIHGNGLSPPSSSVIPLGQQPVTPKHISFDGVQKKQVVTFTQGSPSKPGEFKIKIADVVSGSSLDSFKDSEPRRIIDGKKIITLDTASEIEGLSTGCKVYANIGEDTYDIVIPIKEDPEEGEAKLDLDGLPNRKRMKLKHDDHYELIVDGRVYYICIVCKRSYVCLTSLRRHFNVHSWEKKYPCRYCERVFPLAEYRTKHEIHHTGERRYQCLTCGSSFINYQVMASHIRSVHSLDPSGDSKLYRLNPCKTLQIRQYAYVNNSTNGTVINDGAINVPVITDGGINVPVINDGGIVYDIDPDEPQQPASEGNHANSATKPVNWDNIFIQQSNQNMFKLNTSEGGTEFEFVIPESY